MSKKKILVVEDEGLVAIDIESNLLELGYEVLAVVASGEHAVRVATEALPDLILMDITLDGPLDGIDAAAEIRKSHATPIIYLTSHTDSDTLGKAKITEPFGYLPKPCNTATLKSTIEVALYKSEADRARQQAEDELKRLRDEHEEALRKSEEKYRTVADFTYDWEFWIGPDGKILYCSPACEKVLGFSAAAFENDPSLLRQLVHPDDLAAYDQHCQKVEDQKIAGEFEFRIIRADGSIRWRWICQACRPVYDSNGLFLGTRGSNRDVTERKGLEVELAKARNLESLGILADGIAHDFNNLFQSLLGNLALAKLYTPQSSKALQHLSDAEQVYAQATRLTGQLAAFSSCALSPRVALQPAAFIWEAITSDLQGSDVEVEFDLANDLCPINVDPDQFRQVLRHMIKNAIEAMTAGEKIRVTAVNESLSPEAANATTRAAGNYLKLSIQDHGCGIGREDLPRIFDPYFSTKERGSHKGMGLGLSLCDTIIRKHDGTVTVESKPGKGTTFHVHLPAGVSATGQDEGGK